LTFAHVFKFQVGQLDKGRGRHVLRTTVATIRLRQRAPVDPLNVHLIIRQGSKLPVPSTCFMKNGWSGTSPFWPGTRIASGPFGSASNTCNVTTHWRKNLASLSCHGSTFYSLAILRCRLFNAPFIHTNPIRHTCVRLTNSADARLSETIAGP